MGMPQPPSVGAPPSSSSGGAGRFLGIGFGALMALGVGGAVVAQNVFGIEIPFIGRFIGGGGGGGGKSAKSELKKMGVEIDKADPDVLLEKVGERARKWRGDAKFYSLSINGMKTDGTVDLTKSSTITIEFFSPALVADASNEKRKKSIKKYVFNSSVVAEQDWGVKERHENVPGTPIPKCTSEQIGKVFKDKGLGDGDTFLVSLDPGFAFATNSLSFNAQTTGGAKKVHVYLDINDCKVLKDL